jgi:tRNA1(Val) A37 N6-methylase TrmN6
MNKKIFNQHIRNFSFTQLFNELGWDFLNERMNRKIDDENFEFHSVAHKQGFRIIVCLSKNTCQIPLHLARRKIQTEISKLYHENLLIFVDKANTEQVWQLIDRQPNKPQQVRQAIWKKHQEPELLYQKMKGALFTLSEEEGLTIVDVAQRLKGNFTANAEKVTKQFYDKFKNEHKRFLDFIEGIGQIGDREWYASLMLNRLMFCYFIQKKGFLDSNLNYLRDKLNENKSRQGKDQFYSFYRFFLLNLFHKGLGKPHSDNDIPELGRIPYLNGGLFDVHELEVKYEGIRIKDDAFEKIFNFFDEYNWHLDDSPTATGRDINPDVIGYIFEKYINDRAQMGAYYTKEDITDYISKNCIIPYLFDEVKRNYPTALKPDGECWQMLKDSSDKYIYDAVKHGIPKDGDLFADLPPEVQVGFNEKLAEKPVDDKTSPHLFELRKGWNKPAISEIALPTEIYREVIERRNRYKELQLKIDTGELREINDFITYNLNIKQYTQDVLETTTDPVLIRQFYWALKKVTILDPTCGSGAFLFAAMNILETLYRKCIDRMESFVDEEGTAKHPGFVKELEQVHRPEHPNLDYFIYKSIILNNLYGVDLMNEAVEIAKLRLFLKLMATVDPDYQKDNLGLEPLPDVDFNIRCGNTLVGFATGDELKKGLDYTFDGAIVRPQIEEKCEIVALAFKHYKDIQLNQGDDYKGFKDAKEELKGRLNDLNKELNELLHMQYSGTKYNDWLKSYQPFHWFAEYYEIVEENKGFDVIIGNPPYVEYSDVRKDYTIKDYLTLACGNLFAYAIERAYNLLKSGSTFGFIVPISSVCTPRMSELMKLENKHSSYTYYSNYAVRPDKLFVGADMNLTIHINRKRDENTNRNNCNLFTTKYIRWYTRYRENIFHALSYTNSMLTKELSIYKLNDEIEWKILDKMTNSKFSFKNLSNRNGNVYYHSGGRYFRKCLLNRISNEYKPLQVPETNIYHITAILSSSTYFWYWVIFSDTYHVTKDDIDSFQFPSNSLNDKVLEYMGDKLLIDFEKNKVQINRKRKDGSEQIEINYIVGKSKPIIDEIDTLLATHYGFTEEELDFIIHYDIKYRMGIGSGAEVIDD